LTAGASPSAGAGPTGNGSCTSSTIRSKRSARFADLSSFESCSASVSARSSSSNCSRTGASAAFRRCFWEEEREAGAHLQLAHDVLLRRLDRQRRRQLAHQVLDDRAALAQPDLVDPLPDRVPVIVLQLSRQLEIEPLRLADLAAKVLLRVADLADLGVREVERLEQQLLRDLLRAGLDHRQGVLRADDDQVERRLLL